MTNESLELHAKGQAELIQFLNTDLELGFTLLQTASLTDNAAHRAQALHLVMRVIQTVHQMLGRIEDHKKWDAVNARMNELEAALSASKLE